MLDLAVIEVRRTRSSRLWSSFSVAAHTNENSRNAITADHCTGAFQLDAGITCMLTNVSERACIICISFTRLPFARTECKFAGTRISRFERFVLLWSIVLFGYIVSGCFNRFVATGVRMTVKRVTANQELLARLVSLGILMD